MKHIKRQRGFTLIEILVVIGIIAVLAALVIIAINPAKQFAQARNTTRQSNISAVLDAIGQRMADNRGVFAGSFTVNGTTYTCPTLPTAPLNISTKAGDINLSCLTPTYLTMQIPVDPNGLASFIDASNYDTKYTVMQDAIGRITVCAPNAAGETSVPDAKTLCLTR